MPYAPDVDNEVLQLRKVIAYLVSEFGNANKDWTFASVHISDEFLRSLPSEVSVERDIMTLATVVTVPLEQPKGEEILPLPPPYEWSKKLSELEKKEEAPTPPLPKSNELTTFCKNCGLKITKKKPWTSVWYHRDGNSQCDSGGTWARPKK